MPSELLVELLRADARLKPINDAAEARLAAAERAAKYGDAPASAARPVPLGYRHTGAGVPLEEDPHTAPRVRAIFADAADAPTDDEEDAR